jgi:hypothetical protein
MVPVEMGDIGLEERDGIEAKAVVVQQLRSLLAIIPVTATCADRSSISAMSASVRVNSTAAMFSRTRSILRAPGIGTMLVDLARSQASVTCPGVAPRRSAISLTRVDHRLVGFQGQRS